VLLSKQSTFDTVVPSCHKCTNLYHFYHLLHLFHLPKELIEQIIRILRSGSRFRMELFMRDKPAVFLSRTLFSRAAVSLQRGNPRDPRFATVI